MKCLFRLVMVAWFMGAVPAAAQIGALVSPGPLSKPHAALEGVRNCEQCHERGRQVTATKCLACHALIAKRIAMKQGVHRQVTTDCVSCHVEHAGLDGQLRPFDAAKFNHASETGFPLDGLHKPLACAACHKSRSFVTLTSTCTSCHADVHKGALGTNCANCHPTTRTFKDTKTTFDHSRTQFPLLGVHQAVACATCHPSASAYQGLKFASCTDCHKDPHRQTFGTTCVTCHNNDTWRTSAVDHRKTTYPLVDMHTQVACVKCHAQRPMRATLSSFDRCATCHADAHKGAFQQDCKACHSEKGFSKAPFDHNTTKFRLTEKHTPLACTACHKNVVPAAGVPVAKRVADFRGLRVECVSCHADVHTAQLGTTCETCHTSKSFKLTAYTHKRFSELFEGAHAPLACEKCHTPVAPVPRLATAQRTPALLNVRFKDLSTACVSCHADVHLGQVRSACETCHNVRAARFAVVGFSHDQAKFPLKGLHQSVECAACHRREASTFPTSAGTARRLTGIGVACASCHMDAHTGQLGAKCESCHTETAKAFKIARYAHQDKALNKVFFIGQHADALCEACHARTADKAKAGPATTRYKINPTCTTCHTDIHKGSLGPNCGDCHRLGSSRKRVAEWAAPPLSGMARLARLTHASLVQP